MFQEVLLPEVALPTFGALEGLLPSVFPARSHRGGGAERLPASPSPSAPSGSHHAAGEPAGGKGNLPPSQLRPSSSPAPAQGRPEPCHLSEGGNNLWVQIPWRNHSICPELLWAPPLKLWPELTTAPPLRQPSSGAIQGPGPGLSLLPEPHSSWAPQQPPGSGGGAVRRQISAPLCSGSPMPRIS